MHRKINLITFMEHKSEILDCTLRDGGYYNDGIFQAFLYDYLKLMSIFEVDWVEIGFRKILLLDIW